MTRSKSFNSSCTTPPDKESEVENELEILEVCLLEHSLLVQTSKKPEVLVH